MITKSKIYRVLIVCAVIGIIVLLAAHGWFGLLSEREIFLVGILAAISMLVLMALILSEKKDADDEVWVTVRLAGEYYEVSIPLEEYLVFYLKKVLSNKKNPAQYLCLSAELGIRLLELHQKELLENSDKIFEDAGNMTPQKDHVLH